MKIAFLAALLTASAVSAEARLRGPGECARALRERQSAIDRVNELISLHREREAASLAAMNRLTGINCSPIGAGTFDSLRAKALFQLASRHALRFEHGGAVEAYADAFEAWGRGRGPGQGFPGMGPSLSGFLALANHLSVYARSLEALGRRREAAEAYRDAIGNTIAAAHKPPTRGQYGPEDVARMRQEATQALARLERR